MTWGVCLDYDPRDPYRNAWGYLVQEAGIPNAWERRTPDTAKHAWKGWHFNAALSDIPQDLPLVVLAPSDGTHMQGEHSLYTFEHPKNVIYYFGSDKADMRLRDFNGRGHTSVFIPDCSMMFSFQAAAMVIYDRRAKACR